jgi:hypothetical protein
MPLPPTVKKLRTLAQIAASLQEGDHFEITRLTTLKGFCEDPEATARFALHLAKLTQAKAKPTKPEYEQLIADGVRAMTRHVRNPTEQSEERLWELLTDAKQVQNKFEHQRWADVRLVECWDLLIVETAMECILEPWYSAAIGYQLARKYAEKFDSRYGSGLNQKSAPMVEEIVEFWGRHFFGRGWKKVVGAVT